MDSQALSTTTKAEANDGPEGPSRFQLIPVEVVMIIMDHLTKHELFVLMTMERLLAVVGQPILFQKDARAHDEGSVPEAMMFAAMKSRTDYFLALKIFHLSLENGRKIKLKNEGKINLNNVYKFESSRGYIGLTRCPIATQASLLHFAVVFGCSKFIHFLFGIATAEQKLDFCDARGFGLVDMAVERFGLDLKAFDQAERDKYKCLLPQLERDSRSEYVFEATPLSYALLKDDWDMIEALLTFNMGRTIPYILCHARYSRFDNTDATTLPRTILDWAAMRTYPHKTRKDLSDQFLVNTFRDHLGHQGLEESPLLTAIDHGNASFVRLLLKAGVDPNLVGVTGRIPLVWACRRHRYHLQINAQRADKILVCINVLLKLGADPNLESSGETALEIAMTGISEDLGSWERAKVLVRTLLFSPGMDIHRVLNDGLTVTQRHAKRTIDLPDGSEALGYYQNVLVCMVNEGGHVDVQGQPSVAYTAWSQGRSALYQALCKAGADMTRQEKEEILVEQWVPGDHKERDKIEKQLGCPMKDFGKVINTPESAARIYCDLADHEDDSTVSKLVNIVEWPRKSKTIAHYAIDVIPGWPRNDKLRKFWMTRGFDASVGDSIGLLVLDKLEEQEHYPLTQALEDIKRLYSMGASVLQESEGRSPHQRVKALRLQELQPPPGVKRQNRYQDMMEWFGWAKDGHLSRKDGELKTSSDDEQSNEDVHVKDEVNEITDGDAKMEGAET